MKWRAPVIAAGCALATAAALAIPAAAPATAAAPGNLILNGDAEFGPFAHDDHSIATPVGWKTTGSFTALLYQEPGATIAGSIGAAASTAIHGGRALFAGGPRSGTASATQTFAIPKSLLAAVAAGRARATAAAALGGWQSQGDAATVTYRWLSAGGNELGAVQLGPVTPAQRGNTTKLLPVAKTVAVPAATRLVRVIITATGGGYIDGYADNVSLVLK